MTTISKGSLLDQLVSQIFDGVPTGAGEEIESICQSLEERADALENQPDE